MTFSPASRVVLAIISLLVIWLFSFSETLLSMVAIWQRSETFAHGYLIFPISIYLIWRRRFLLLSAELKPSLLPMIAVLACNFAWLAAQVAGIQVLAQLAAVAWLPCALWCLFGHKFLSICWFPLGYLVFAVPMGEELIPQLQMITADITVFLLGVTGIPVFRDGLYIAVPGGLFEVAVACSGIRYLIASVALGTLFAHLQFASLKRQLIFVVIAAIVPIAANGIRAYIIVLLAYSSDMALATGVDHLIYGWLFFGLVMFILFWIGSYWREDKAEPPHQTSGQGRWLQPGKRELVFTLMLMSLLATHLYQNKVIHQLPPNLSLDKASLAALFSPTRFDKWQPEFNNADDYFMGSAEFSGQPVQLYIAFYAQNSQSKELVNTTHHLFNRNSWTLEQHKNSVINAIPVGQQLLTSPFGDKLQLHYWYQLDNSRTANGFQIKLEQSWRTLTARSSAGMVVILATQKSPQSEQALQQASQTLHQLDKVWYEQ